MSSPTRILAAVDFSPQSQSIIDQACDLAELKKAELHVIHVASPSTDHELDGEATRLGLEQLASLVRPADELELTTEKRVLRGVPHRAIVEYAKSHSVDLIVMGTHGRKGFSHLALGSVAERVLRSAPCSVQVIRSPPRKLHQADLAASLLAETFGEDSQSPATELIVRARRLRATDIHLDPTRNDESRVRLRIDGQLVDYCQLDRQVAEHIVNQWKMMAGLDIAEPFHPLEGRIAIPATATELADVEARVTLAPVAGGEAVAMRLFSHDDVYIPLTEIGFSPSAQSAVDAMLQQSEGLVLVSGPTGSGKTTTVYSMLETISDAGRNIVSIEDPVEFSVPFVRQMAVDTRHGISMTEGLTTLLRMDPDVVFLGEIRDTTAAEIAMRAASAGRYVFTTLHTRDVASVVTSLRDMGLADRSLAANIAGVVNQRLMRRLCTGCRQPLELTPATRKLFKRHRVASPRQVYETVGCARCRGTGYRGRIGIFEAVHFNSELRAAVAGGISEADLRAMLSNASVASLDMDALEKVAAGITDLGEMQRVHWLR